MTSPCVVLHHDPQPPLVLVSPAAPTSFSSQCHPPHTIPPPHHPLPVHHHHHLHHLLLHLLSLHLLQPHPPALVDAEVDARAADALAAAVVEPPEAAGAHGAAGARALAPGAALGQVGHRTVQSDLLRCRLVVAGAGLVHRDCRL